VSASAPIRLPTKFLDKPWGACDLSPWYPLTDSKIGEVWFEADLPILVKFIRADPGAQLGIGFRKPVTQEQLREAAGTEKMVDLIQWVEVHAGDVFFIPAGTVHAIGGGLALCEIQQHSDIVYRLYDYGRPRELHLDKAIQVASLTPSDPKPLMLPVDCEYFHVELDRTASSLQYKPEPGRFHLLVFLSGSGTLAGQAFREGETWLIPAGANPFIIQPTDPVKFLRAWAPDSTV